MSDEEKPQPPTAKISEASVINARLDQITMLVRDGFASQANTLTEFGERLVRVEIRQRDLEERMTRNSTRVGSESQTNMKQDAAISTLVADVSELKKTQDEQLGILKRLDAVAAHPMVRKVAYAVGLALLSYLATKGWITR